MIIENIYENSLPNIFDQCKKGVDPDGRIIFVTLSPIIKHGEFIGCVQTVRLKHTASENANDRMG
jgi:hypothetical protein